MAEGWDGHTGHRRSPHPEYRARLECGCVIWLRCPPITERARFGCNMGLGHGYRLRWTVAWAVADPENEEVNRAYQALKEHEEGEGNADR